MMDLAAFHKEFFQEIAASAGAEGHWKEAVFFEKVGEFVEGTGEIDTADYVPWMSPRRDIRIDGYCGDPRDSEGILTLIVSDFSPSPELAVLNKQGLLSVFSKALEFLKQSLDEKFRNNLEESSSAFGLADLIASRWSSLSKVRVMLFTNRELRTRIDGMKGGELKGVEVVYNVWDIARLHTLVMSGKGHEDREIDFVKEFGGAVPALAAHLQNATYEAFVMVLPGTQLAAIYDRWGPSLLEQNVRSFLQARGGVNKGIRRTIDTDPEMFFAYNNGITATAESVQTDLIDGHLKITQLKNLQIVNGGQTTASIHAASRAKGADISRVFVQMKLSIVKPERTEEVVPKISEYANSQNKVNAADFFANHPFHIEMQRLSRQVRAPSMDGGFLQTKWFYERARGQYIDAKARLSGADKKKFDLEYPKAQMIEKTALAKYLNLWPGQPHVVCRGNQKNFVEFAKQIGESWDARKDDFNETFFRECVAKAIIFRETEKIVSDQRWYTGGGSRAPIVAHSIAKLASDMKARGDAVNFDLVWRFQKLPTALRNAMIASATACNDVITSPPGAGQSPTEWAKQPACWKRVQELEIEWPDDIDNILLTRADAAGAKRAARSDRRLMSGIEAQAAVVKAGPAFWSEVLSWAKRNRRMSPIDAGILQMLATPGKLASERQSVRAVELLAAMNSDGCELELPRSMETLTGDF